MIQHAADSTDSLYGASLAIDDVTVTVYDDDVTGVIVNPTANLVVSEDGTLTDTFTVVLSSQPRSDVTITLDPGPQVNTHVPQLIFTPVNWATAQTVTLSAVDDAIDEGEPDPFNHLGAVNYSVSSSDQYYDAIVPASGISVIVRDNDTSGVTVTVPGGVLNVAETGTTSESYSIVLDSQPQGDVTITIDPGTQVETDVQQLVFTPANWMSAQSVQVTAIDDAIDEGNPDPFVHPGVIHHSVASSDPFYDQLSPVADATASVADNDQAGVSVSPVTGLVTTEAGGTATFTVVLDSQPTAPVSVALSSNDLSEGTVPLASLSFDANNWSTPQTVTVIGVDDLVDDGDVSYLVVTSPVVSSDPLYSGLNPADVAINNTDNDVAGITVAPFEGLATTEAGATATFTVVLDSEPTATVIISLSSNDTSEGTIGKSSLSFDASDWDTPQTITITVRRRSPGRRRRQLPDRYRSRD